MSDKVVYQTKTDKSGEFRFAPAWGDYTLRVVRTEYAPAMREIVVTDEVVTALGAQEALRDSGAGRLRGCLLGGVDEQESLIGKFAKISNDK